MRVKFLSAVLLTGLISFTASAGFEQFNDPVGGMNVFDSTGQSYLFYSAWDVPDLQAITTDNRTFELLPNTNAYNEADSFWSDGNGDGNKVLEANTLFEMSPISADITSATFNFTVDAFTLSNRYSLTGFIKVINPDTGYSQSIIDDVEITGTGSHSLQISTSGLSGQLMQAGWMLRGLNANPDDDWGSAMVTATELYAVSNDSTPPQPSQMSFAVPPTTVSDSAITMTAITATDDNYDVEYLFTNFTAGTSSDWQSDTNYTETGLSAGTTYFYSVIARDTSGNDNRNSFSPIGSATTAGVDPDPPAPSQMSFTEADASPVTVKLTAVTATDTSGVEYFFTCIAGDGNDSGWQSSPVYYDTGLLPGSNYSYTVIARDLSSAQNSNTVSAVTNITTMSVQSGSFTNTLTGYTGSTDDMAVMFELEKDGFTTGSMNEDAVIDFGASGAVFGDGFAASGRNLIKTIDTGYQAVSFEAYATLTFSGATDLSGFIGMGQGIQTGVPNNYGVPELNLEGVNGVVAQFKDSTAASGTQKCNLFKFIGGDASESSGGNEILSNPVSSTETIRARLIYDAAAETVNVSFDKNYTGGMFVADQDMGTVSTTNGAASMWDGAPVSIYTGGGEGTIVKDFEVVVTSLPPPAQPPFDVQAAGAAPGGGGMIFTWDSVSGRTYGVQYKTNLVTDVEWMTDPSPGASGILSDGGSISATSTVDSASVFYRIISE